jgi:hypothetical protein
MDGYSAYIKHETLSREILAEVPPADAFAEEHKLGGHVIVFGVVRQS